jgi:hypothetical protein
MVVCRCAKALFVAKNASKIKTQIKVDLLIEICNFIISEKLFTIQN